MTTNVETEPQKERERFRLAPGTDLRAIEHFPYMLQLMASLESIRGSLRWLEHVKNADSSFLRSDIFIVVVTGAGWCAETFRLLKQGIRDRVISKSMVGSDDKLRALWERVSSSSPDELVRKVHRIRDQYFGHWDSEVFKSFIEWQSSKSETEPLIESDARGKFLHTRYLWPWTAFAYDLVGDPTEEANQTRARDLLHSLAELWAQTANLISQLLKEMIKARGLSFDKVKDS